MEGIGSAVASGETVDLQASGGKFIRTRRPERMSHRKGRETKQQPSRARSEGQPIVTKYDKSQNPIITVTVTVQWNQELAKQSLKATSHRI